MTLYQPAVQTDCVVDLSHSNAIADPVAAFAAAKASGVELIIQKATQGTGFTDPTFTARRVAAEKNGLLFGAYHFCTEDDPVAQMRHFLAVVGNPQGILLALDAEKNASQVTVAQVAAMIGFLQVTASRVPLLYMGASGPDGSGMSVNTVLGQCDLWLPEYGNRPILPPGFSRWVLHQYTGDGINGSGAVAGIGTGLDRSYFAGTVSELRAWFVKATGGVTPGPLVASSGTAPAPTASPGSAKAASVWPDLATGQAELGVTADGIFGPITAAAIAAHYGA